ncbi:MAG TPA: hypothetical protein VKU02_25285 [Gemmataceae bacterium]|nr:hypothetical protein [Gemmataceae bacterium]
MDGLEASGLVGRSQVSQGARLYHFIAPPEPLRLDAFERLRVLTAGRAGRLRLAKQLRRSEQFPSAGPEATWRFPAKAQHIVRANKQRPRHRGQGRGAWRKAI